MQNAEGNVRGRRIEQLIEFGAQGICLMTLEVNLYCDPDNGGHGPTASASRRVTHRRCLTALIKLFFKDGKCDANFGDGDGVY